MRAPRHVEEHEIIAAAIRGKKRRPAKLLAAALVLVLVAGAAIIVRSRRTTSGGTAAGATMPAGKSIPPADRKATPSSTVNAIAAAPAQAVAKADAAVDAAAAARQDLPDAKPVANDAVEKPAVSPTSGSTAKPGRPAPSVSTASQIAPGITAVTGGVRVAGSPSAAFLAWATNVKINGVFQGTPARALINGRTFREGQSVEDVLGITLDRVDTGQRLVVFRDRSGATASLRY